jgi:hypothetical protein
MSDVLEFKPDELEILEEFVYDEEVQRPEALRFYPLEEQLDDLVRPMLQSAMVSPDAPVPDSVMRKARKLREQVYDLYMRSTTFDTESGAPRSKRAAAEPLERNPAPKWIIPYVKGTEIMHDLSFTEVPSGSSSVRVISSRSHLEGPKPRLPLQQVARSFEAQRTVDNEVGGTPFNPSATGIVAVYDGFRPKNTGSKIRPIWTLEPTTKQTKLLNPWIYWKGIPQSNGSMPTVPTVAFPGEAREVRGWIILPPDDVGRIDPRAIVAGEIADVIMDPPTQQVWFQPKPVLLHEWRDLSANRPTIQEVLDHAPSRIPDKLMEAYLRTYGLEFQDIPWNIWSQLLSNNEPQLEPYDPSSSKKQNNDLNEILSPPSSVLLPESLYGPYYPAMHIIAWTKQQPDGGQWIRWKHLEQSIQDVKSASGSLLLLDHPVPSDLQPTNVSECLLSAGSWREFRGRGVFQSETRLCLPVDIVARSQQVRRSKDRIALKEFREKLAQQMRQLEIELVSRFKQNVEKENENIGENLTNIPSPEEAKLQEARTKLLKILNEEDLRKASQIRSFLQEIGASSKSFQWHLEGGWLLCQHTLELLDAQEKNKDAMEAFDNEWTVVMEGGRVCRFCGERISKDVWDTQYDFDENGYVRVNRQVLEEVNSALAPAPSVTEREIVLKNILKSEERADGRILFLLITALALEPQIELVRKLAESGFAFTDQFIRNYNVPTEQTVSIRVFCGIALFVLLLKTHSPILRPNRRFKSYPFSLEGFPRSRSDADSNNSPVLDYVLGTLAFVFQEGVAQLLRKDVLYNPLKLLSTDMAKVQATIIRLIRLFLTQDQGFESVEFVNSTPTIKHEVGYFTVTSQISSYDDSEPRNKSAVELGLWLYKRRILKANTFLEPRSKDEPMEKRMQPEWDDVVKSGSIQNANTFLFWAPALQFPKGIGRTEARKINQNPNHIQIIKFLKDSKKRSTGKNLFEDSTLAQIVGSKKDSEVESAVRILLSKNKKLVAREILNNKHKELDEDAFAAYNIRVFSNALNAIYRFFVGKPVFGLMQRGVSALFGEQSAVLPDKLKTAIAETDTLLGKIPTTANPKKLEEIEQLLRELYLAAGHTLDSTRIHIEPQWDVAWAATTRAIELLREEFGKETTDFVFNKIVEWYQEPYRFSPQQIAEQLLKQRAAERKEFASRLGQLSDTERNLVTDMMNIGLLRPVAVVTSQDRAEMAEELEEKIDSEDFRLAISVSEDSDLDTPGHEQIFDRGSYGDLMNTPSEIAYNEYSAELFQSRFESDD